MRMTRIPGIWTIETKLWTPYIVGNGTQAGGVTVIEEVEDVQIRLEVGTIFLTGKVPLFEHVKKPSTKL